MMGMTIDIPIPVVFQHRLRRMVIYKGPSASPYLYRATRYGFPAATNTA